MSTTSVNSPGAASDPGSVHDLKAQTTVHVRDGVRLILATHNEHKVRELREILVPLVSGLAPEHIIGAESLALPEPVEDGVTFEQNALIKARAVASATGVMTLADDSGLGVDVMGGAPGIFSARWAGRHGDDAANRHLLLAQLADIAREHRGAQFTCAAALVVPHADGSMDEHVETGVMRGHLGFTEHGENGFGYDPVFYPDGYDRTNAELRPQEKDAISHRGKAFRQLAPFVEHALALGTR
ncbi:MAG: RdgB/HAM1 family non-canonical purine NTP pyrophosphatase [Actinomycetaceae bacterium]|nr:RdgB/HAM1 family non-canonical purine NTP pyrophosphatase [Actinomycetaceae bacterium]MDY6083339.1 RdgB/HAM1 family non-canonical purine NTP pyrophosphatase [Actinomycetaceae bacterium]